MVANITSYALAIRLSPTPIYDALLLQDGIHLPHAERQSLKQIPLSAAVTTVTDTVATELQNRSRPDHFLLDLVSLPSRGKLQGIYQGVCW